MLSPPPTTHKASKMFGSSKILAAYGWLCLLIVVSGEKQAQTCDIPKVGKRSWADIASGSSKSSQQGNVKSSRTWADAAGQVDASAKPPAAKKVKPTPVKKGTAIYTKLPAGAKRFMVRNVYDGDTLTLIDGQRVRFLGIDTPEISENQPYAKEAKAYVRKYCHKKEIYLTYDQYGDRKDKFGRLLAFVWAYDKSNDGYICVNEGVVAEGLATVYLPRKNAKLSNLRKLITLQKEARKAKRGIWSKFVDYKVLVTPNGAAYHVAGCRHIANNRNLRSMMASAAADNGLHPCRTCLADA